MQRLRCRETYRHTKKDKTRRVRQVVGRYERKKARKAGRLREEWAETEYRKAGADRQVEMYGREG